MPANQLRNPQRRTIFSCDDGMNINWRQSVKADYGSEAEFYADAGHMAPTASNSKEPIPFETLVSVQYSKDKFEDSEFFMRLVFEGHRNLDIKLRSKQDFEYCMDGFELINKNREYFTERRKHSVRPNSMAAIHMQNNYMPVMINVAGKNWNVGCGNDWEDIFLM